MFDLEREVRVWSEAAIEGRCRDGAAAAELADHLYCEIERERVRGASDQEAFALATRRLGPRQALAAEFARGRSLLERGCAVAARLDRSTREDRRYLVAHAILWAVLAIAGALLAKKAGASASSAFEWMLLLVVIPGWLASEQILRRALRVGAARRV